MSKEENADTKFVRAFFGLIAWLMIVVPFLAGLYYHYWWLVLGVGLGALGGTIKTAIHNTDKLNNITTKDY